MDPNVASIIVAAEGVSPLVRRSAKGSTDVRLAALSVLRDIAKHGHSLVDTGGAYTQHCRHLESCLISCPAVSIFNVQSVAFMLTGACILDRFDSLLLHRLLKHSAQACCASHSSKHGLCASGGVAVLAALEHSTVPDIRNLSTSTLNMQANSDARSAHAVSVERATQEQISALVSEIRVSTMVPLALEEALRMVPRSAFLAPDRVSLILLVNLCAELLLRAFLVYFV